MKLLGISGSATKSGRTRAAVQLALDSARHILPELDTQLVDLCEWKVSLFDGRPLAEYTDDTQGVVEMIQHADCFLIGSPIYRGTYTGALKNLLDHVPLEALMGKVVGLIATGATAHHYLAIDHELRALMAYFNAYVLPGSVYIEQAQFREQDVVDSQALQHLYQLGQSVVQAAKVLRGVVPSPPPLAQWIRATRPRKSTHRLNPSA